VTAGGDWLALSATSDEGATVSGAGPKECVETARPRGGRGNARPTRDGPPSGSTPPGVGARPSTRPAGARSSVEPWPGRAICQVSCICAAAPAKASAATARPHTTFQVAAGPRALFISRAPWRTHLRSASAHRGGPFTTLRACPEPRRRVLQGPRGDLDWLETFTGGPGQNEEPRTLSSLALAESLALRL